MMNMPCASGGCRRPAQVVIKQVPLCHRHYTLLRLELDLEKTDLSAVSGSVLALLRKHEQDHPSMAAAPAGAGRLT